MMHKILGALLIFALAGAPNPQRTTEPPPFQVFLPLVARNGTATAVTLTQSQSLTVVADNSIACGNQSGTLDNAYLRQFSLSAYGIAGAFDVHSVMFGIEFAESGTGEVQQVTVRLYRKIDPSGPLAYGNLAQIGRIDRMVSDQVASLYIMPVAGTVPAGGVLAVEVFAPGAPADFFFVGSNSAGQTGASYLASVACGWPQPTDVAALGFPNMHIVMSVTGVDEEGTVAVIGDIPALLAHFWN